MKVLLVAVSMMLVPLTFASMASADWTCGDPTGLGLDMDSCGGDTNTDNPYAGCDGEWRDLFQDGSYFQVCVGDSANVWACPNSNSYSTNHPSCTHLSA